MPFGGNKAKASQVLLKVNWKQEYSVGIPIIDNQHKELFEIVNTLIAYYNEPEKLDLFYSYLNILVDYTVEHFSTEERILEEMSSSELEHQKTEHSEFKERVISAITCELEDEVTYRHTLIIFLQEWLTKHIINSDIPAFYN